MAYLQKDFVIKFVKTHPKAVLPVAAHEVGDAGFDLRAVESVLLQPGTATAVSTGLQLADCELEDRECNQYFLEVRSRSGLAKRLVFPVTGTVDVIYRGEIFVLLANLGREPYQIEPGDRIAQLVLQVIFANSSSRAVKFMEVSEVVPTDRGAGGFGSTGR